MRKTFLLAALLGLLLEPSRPVLAQQRPTLEADRFCLLYADMVYKMAEARDRGISLTAVLTYFRHAAEQFNDKEAGDLFMRGVQDHAAAVYMDPRSPREIRAWWMAHNCPTHR